MHVTDGELKVLIDVLTTTLDDDLDMVGDELSTRYLMDDDRRAEVQRVWELKDLVRKLREESRARRGARSRALDVESATRFDREVGPEKGGDDVKRVEDADDPIQRSSALDALSESVRSLRLEVGDVRSSLMGFADWARPTLVRLRGKVDGLEREVSEWVSELERRMEVLSDDVGKLGMMVKEHSGSSEVRH